MTLRVAVAGAAGRMGRLVLAEILAADDLVAVAAVARPGSPHAGEDLGTVAGTRPVGVALVPPGEGCLADAEVVVDFSTPAGLVGLLPWLGGRALVSGTTGLTEAERERVLDHRHRGAVLHAANFSAGVTALGRLVALAARAFPHADVEILEAHHAGKRDAPSGTALALGRAAASARGVSLDEVAVHGRAPAGHARRPGEIGFHALRGGDIVGEHQVWVVWPGERLLLGHVAHGRGVFAAGAIRAARWIAERPPGIYQMSDVVGL